MKKIIVLGLLFNVLCFGSGAFAQRECIVAVVNREVITQSDLNSFLRFLRMQLSAQYQGKELEERYYEVQKEALTRLIEDKIIVQEAKKEGLKADQSRVRERLNAMKDRYGSEKEFTDSYIKNGLTLADMENKIRDQILMYQIIQSKIRDKIKIHPKEITDFYESHKEEMSQPATRHVQAVSASEEASLRLVSEELKKGTAFSDAASMNGLEMNDLGDVRAGDMRKEIDEVISLLAPGEYSEIVAIDNKYFIFKLIDKTDAQQRSLDEAKSYIQEYLFEQKMQQDMVAWIDELKKKSYIDIKQQG